MSEEEIFNSFQQENEDEEREDMNLNLEEDLGDDEENEEIDGEIKELNVSGEFEIEGNNGDNTNTNEHNEHNEDSEKDLISHQKSEKKEKSGKKLEIEIPQEEIEEEIKPQNSARNKPNLCALILENLNKKSGSINSLNSLNSLSKPTSPMKDQIEVLQTHNDRISTNEKSLTSGALLSSQEQKRFHRYRSNNQNFNLDNFESDNNSENNMIINSSENKILKLIKIGENLEKNEKNEKIETITETNIENNPRIAEEKIVSDSISASGNSGNTSQISYVVQKKVPILLNNLQTMFDLNSDRVKKRSEQMKKRKVKYEEEGDVENSENNNPISARDNNQNGLAPPIENRKIKLNSNKKFLEEEEINNNNSAEKKDISENDNENELNNLGEVENKDEPEVVVSDLEYEIDEKSENSSSTPNIISNASNTKSFIPLQNHLRSKRAVSVDKATPSYLMALYQYEESDNSNKNSLNNSYSEYNNLGENAKESSNNLANINMNNNFHHNYLVEDVIEEETSENNTDSELSARKRSSIFFKTHKSSDRDSNPFSAYSSSPNNHHKRFNVIPPAIIKLNYNSNSDMRHSKSEGTHPKKDLKDFVITPTHLQMAHANTENNNNFTNIFSQTYSSYNSNESNRSRKKIPHHKNSKSEFNNFQVDMKKMLDNLEKRRLSENEDRIEKIKLRKNTLLNKFFKSNSHHNLPYNIGTGSGKFVQREKEKKLSICTPSSEVLDNMFKRLSPSGASRAFYYDYNVKEDKNEGNLVSFAKNLKFDEEECENVNDNVIDNENAIDEIEKENFINFENENENEDENDGEVIENKSIVEIKDDEDVNFEAELNIQLEKNSLIDEEEGDNLLAHNLHNLHNTGSIIHNEVFNFQPTPISSRKNTAEKPKRAIFESQDMKISQGDKFDVVQDISVSIRKNLFSNSDKFDKFDKFDNLVDGNSFNPTISTNNYNNYVHKNNKSITIAISESSQNFLEILPKKPANFEISSITMQIFPNLKNIEENKTVYNNNYINNNINNISISIVNSDSNNMNNTNMNNTGNNQSSNNLNNSLKITKKILRQKNNSMTNDIRQKYKGHYKSPSINIAKVQALNEEKVRSNSFSKNSQISIHAMSNVADHSKIEKVEKVDKLGKSNKGSVKQSGINTPKKNKLGVTKGDLKHYLIYSESKVNDTKDLSNNNLNSMNSFASMTNLNNLISNSNLLSDFTNIRVNSETSVNNLLNPQISNKQIIQEALKFLKFQISSLDHQKFTLDKLHKSKAKLFCLLIAADSTLVNFVNIFKIIF